MAGPITLDLTCTCGRHRLGIPTRGREPHAVHACPYSVLVHGAAPGPDCNCCSACTALCTPLKFVRDREEIRVARGDAVASLYGG